MARRKSKKQKANTLNKRKQRFAEQVRKLLLREMRAWK
jgi:hypothetical protein